MNETQTYKNFKDRPRDNFPEMIIVHHSGGINSQPLLDTSHHTAQIMEAQHLANGWEGLGYHYVIHKNGDIWKGRPEHYHGAHSVTENTKSIGICLAGNFDATLPTPEQILALTSLMRDIMTRYPKITYEQVFPHRKFAKKTCYGKKLSDDWAKNLLKTPAPIITTELKIKIKEAIDLLQSLL